MNIPFSYSSRARTIVSAVFFTVLLPLSLGSAQDAPAQDAQTGQGACKLGAQVVDRRNRSGIVVEAKGADCRVRYADGTIHYYLAWMLESASQEGVSSKSNKALTVGSYQCYAAAGVAGTLRLIIRSKTEYADRNGKIGRYIFDPQTRKIVFESGPWAGYFGAQLSSEKIGISSRPGSFYNTSCDLE